MPGLPAALSRALSRWEASLAAGVSSSDAIDLMFVAGLLRVALAAADDPAAGACCRAVAASAPLGAAAMLELLADPGTWESRRHNQRARVPGVVVQQAAASAAVVLQVVAQRPSQPHQPQGAAARACRSHQPGATQQGVASRSAALPAGRAGPSNSSSVAPATAEPAGVPTAGGAAPRSEACSVCGGGPRPGATKLLLCARCLKAGPRYCSQECQKAHWRAHKAVCGRAQGAGAQ